MWIRSSGDLWEGILGFWVSGFLALGSQFKGAGP